MRGLVGVGISVGVLAGPWTQMSIELALITWVAFVAWATSSAAGGGREGFTKGLAANLPGVAWAWVAARAGFDLGGTVLALVIGAGLGWLSAVPAAEIQAVVDGTGSAAPLTPAPEAA